MRAAGNETGEMRHVDHEIGAAAVGTCAEPGEVDDPRISAAEWTLGAVDGEPFGNVDIFAAAVIAPSGISFRVFVGEHRALCLEHRSRYDVFAGDQFDLRMLALLLAADGGGDLRVGVGEG